MKNKSQYFLILVFTLFLGDSIFGSELCLESWEGGPEKQVGYVGNGGDGYGDFCLRVTMFVTKHVGGEFCLNLDTTGAIGYDLHGSSFNTGKDCYSGGYNDAMHKWSHSCAFTGPDQFLVDIQSVNLYFCGGKDDE